MKQFTIILLMLFASFSFAQNHPIDFEPGGYGADWTWTVFENESNPPLEIVANPDPSDINNSANVAKFTALEAGQPWAGVESQHGVDLGTFEWDDDNRIVKIMVWKSVISDVGIKFATETGWAELELKVSNTVTNEWEELTFNFSNAINPPDPEHGTLGQIIIFPDFDNRDQDNVVYFDNITFEAGGDDPPPSDSPEVAAPTPTQNAENVISLFSVAYDDVPVDTWRTDWSAADYEEVTIDGRPTKKYTNLDNVGIETVANQIDITEMTHFHMHVWSPNFTLFRVKLVDFGPDGEFGGGDDTEHELIFESPAQGQWVSLDMHLDDFTELENMENIAQLILSGQPVGATTVYVDNVYFYADIPPALYTVTFVVKDTNGDDIENASITLGNIENGIGDYVFPDVSPGVYDYLVTAPGFVDVEGEVTVADVPVVKDILMEEEIIYTVEFEVIGNNGELVATVDGNEIDPGEAFDPETTVVFTATPDAGYEIKQWTLNGDLVVDEDEEPVTVESWPYDLDKDISVTVEFSPIPYTLDVVIVPEGSGFVSIEPDQDDYNVGQMVTLTATATGTFMFQNWRIDGDIQGSENILVYEMPAENVVIEARFTTSPTFTLTLLADPEDGGILSGDGKFLEGEEVTVKADANPGYQFLNWTSEHEDVPGSDDPQYTFVMPGATVTLTAHFEELYTVTFDVVDEAGEAIVDAVVTLDTLTNEAGSYEFTDIPAGVYTYTVTADGFFDYNGEITVEEDVTVDVQMVPETYTLTFSITDESDEPITNAIITVGEIANDEGDYIFTGLTPGIYDYLVSAEGYLDEAGEIEISDEDLAITIVMTLDEDVAGPRNPIDFEPDGYGADWTWTVFENDTNPPLEIIDNPDPTGINTSATVAKFTALEAGEPWAGVESQQGVDLGTFEWNNDNRLVKIQVWKPVISDVGIKFATETGWAEEELKVANTVTNEWEELTFDFSNAINPPDGNGTLGQIIIFPDFDLDGREQDNIIYFDNITFGPVDDDPPPTDGPEVAAPTPPARNPEDVISVFSHAYDNVEGTDFFPDWGQTTQASIVEIDGIETLKYANFNYQGTQFANPLNVTEMEALHLDMWTADATSVNVFLISTGPEETPYALPITTNEWVSYDIPLTEFAGVDLEDVIQFKFDGGDGSQTIYLDNLYFFRVPTSISEISQDQFKVYPNPVRSGELVRLSNKAKQVDVFDMAGKLIQSFVNTSTVETDQMNRGVYFMRIQSDEGNIQTNKLIVK